MELLVMARRWHRLGTVLDDVTVSTCWHADRHLARSVSFVHRCGEGSPDDCAGSSAQRGKCPSWMNCPRLDSPSRPALSSAIRTSPPAKRSDTMRLF